MKLIITEKPSVAKDIARVLNIKDLSIFPQKFKYTVNPKTQKQYETV